jgi:hypothetical protein
MSKHDEKLAQKSPAKPEISAPLDENDLDKVTGGDNTAVLQHECVADQYKTVGLGMRKSGG